MTEITTYCHLCKKKVKVVTMHFGDDQSLGFQTECGHPKSFALQEQSLSLLELYRY